MTVDIDLCYTPAAELAVAIRERRLSPVELLEAVLARYEEVNPKINAFVVVDPDRARAAAKRAEQEVMAGGELGPLHGIPVSIKDLVPVAGLPTRSGSRTTSPEPSPVDSVGVSRLKKAGAIVFGKTTTPEFGCKPFTDSPLSGVTRNPWNLAHSSGGSSGGAAAAVCAGIGPLALGSDGGGSIRIPSTCCGTFGLKPTVGRVANYPSPNPWNTMSKTGPMTRTVRDAALMLSVIAGRDERDPISSPAPVEDWVAGLDGDLHGIKMAWSPDLGYCTVDPEVQRLTTAAARTFAELGADWEEAGPGFANPHDVFITYFSGDTFAGRLAHLLPDHQEEMDPYLVGLIELGLRLTPADMYRAHGRRAELYLAMARFFEKYDLLLTPALGHPALPAIYDITNGITVAGKHFPNLREGYSPFMFPFNMTGHPAAAVPCGFTAGGLPVSLQIVGRPFAEGLVLKAAAAFEAARPWAQHRPPL
ncbi:MAG: amidase family protein [Dehalococcoidales bacterium]|nr:amidase family protein [Dehalococcoidales bacterium]